MNPYSFRDKAKAFLNLADQVGETNQREEEMAKLRLENEAIKAESDAKLTKMQEQMDALMAMMAKPKGRPKKEVVKEAETE